jgi:hypothetical protein
MLRFMSLSFSVHEVMTLFLSDLCILYCTPHMLVYKFQYFGIYLCDSFVDVLCLIVLVTL